MSAPFLGEIRVVSFNFPPKGWALCNGQLLSISQNAALFSLLGTTYGGNGTTTFQLPNYQARMPVHVGNGYVQVRQSSGEPTHTLIQCRDATSHPSSAVGVTTNANSASASGNAWSVVRPESPCRLAQYSDESFGVDQCWRKPAARQHAALSDFEFYYRAGWNFFHRETEPDRNL